MNSKLYCINPNTKEYEEVKTIFGINIEEILDLIRDYKMSKDLKFDKFGKLEEIERLHSIIKEVREYIETKYDYLLGDDTFLDHDERIDRKQIKHILGILDKENNKTKQVMPVEELEEYEPKNMS